jgi:hypothetical protein
MPAPITAKEINPANAFLARQAIEVFDAATNRYIPWTGGTATVGYYTASNATGGITGLVDIPMDEVAGAPGTYALAIPSALLAALAPYAGQVIYQIVKAGPSQNVQVATPLRVTSPRWAQ